MRRLQIDPKHLAVIASLAIFFAWSVDNLIKKSIDGTVSAISSAEEAWIQADRYQELARYQQEIFTALKGLFMEFVRVHGDKLGMSKIQLRKAMETKLAAETTKDFIQRNAQTASVLMRAFGGVALSKNTHMSMQLHYDELWRRAKESDKARIIFQEKSRNLFPLETNFNMEDVTEEQAQSAQMIASQYLGEVGKSLDGIDIHVLKLRQATEAALNELNSKKSTLKMLSGFVSWFHLSLFVLGSLLAIFVKFRGSNESR